MKSLVVTGAIVLAGAGVLLAASTALHRSDLPGAESSARPVSVTLSAREIDPATRAAVARSHAAGVPMRRLSPPASAHSALVAPALAATLDSVVKKTCAGCHSEQRKAGNLSLSDFDINMIGGKSPDVAEKMIGKLRTGMMPPPGRPRPAGDTLDLLMKTLERTMDARYALAPNPGARSFQRLNRAEFERSVKELLDLDIKAESWLPLDTKSANFDNIADVQMPSATVLDGYLDAASDISRIAVGDPKASTTTATYKIPRLMSQLETVEGAPQGTRGGTSVMHNFPADGDYVFAVMLHAIPTGQLYGSNAPFDEKIEVSVNGDRVALLEVDRGMSQADPTGMEIRTKPVRVKAGPNRITAAFLRTFDGPVNDNIMPIGHSISDTQIGSQSGITIQSHLQNFSVTGPYNPTGVSDTPARRRIFSCRPTSEAEARPCAERIVNRLGAIAYRRPLAANDTKALMTFYDNGAKSGGFEVGVRDVVEALLASPHFLFRVEEVPAAAKAGTRVAVNPMDLASRLSFFLWGAPPDSQLVAAARSGRLADTLGIIAQTRRMLKDSRSEALATRFAAQWLRLQDVDLVHPDAVQYPDFHEQLADDMKRETELFFYNLVKENRSLLEMYTANYSFMNEPLARHYGIKGVVGDNFRKVSYPDSTRTGIFGHASILTLTSHANRTSPVLRGKWVMEVLMASPPPPPPPNVPDLEKTGEAKEGRMLTTRERMEMHRDNASCRSCHAFIDPIGLALDNFDVTGRWRIRENGSALDTRGDFYDGTKISTPMQLQQALLKRPVPLVRAFTANLMAYALGRRVEFYDMPAIRRIESVASKDNYRMNDFILGVVKSDAFRLRMVGGAGTASAISTEK